MDYGKLFRRSWEIVWQNKYLFVLGFLAALGGNSSGSGNNVNYRMPSPSSPGGAPFPSDFLVEFTNFWGEYGGIILGLICFFFMLGIVFWLIRLTAQGGLIESVDRIEAGEKMSFASAFSAGVGRIWGLAGLSLLLNAPFFIFGMIFLGAFFFAFLIPLVQSGGTISEGVGGVFSFLAICGGLLTCVLVPLGLVVLIVQPFAQRGLILKQLGVVESVRHGWQVVRNNIGDVILLGIAFLVFGFLFGLVTLVLTLPFAFLAAGPFLLDAIQGNEITFGLTEVVSLAFGGVCLVFVSAAVNSILTAYRSTTVTLAYQQFVQKEA